MSVSDVNAAVLTRHALPPLDEESDKNDRGEAFIIAGGAEVPGAPILTGLAALRVGAGKLSLAAPVSLAQSLGLAVPEARIINVDGETTWEFSGLLSERMRVAARAAAAIVIGPGMTDRHLAGDWARSLYLSHERVVLVIDAAAVTGLQPGRDKLPDAARAVLTPHHGELASIFGVNIEAINKDPTTWAKRAAEEFNAVTILKGAASFIAEPGGEVWLHKAAAPGLGTSGSGDVLAGAVGGLLARGADGVSAALWGVALHARAGARLAEKSGAIGYLARDILRELTPALADLQRLIPNRSL